jgi:hypothetical protein
MGLRKLTSDLSALNSSDYPYHNQYDDGGSSVGSSTSIFDTRTFTQRSFGYGNSISTPLITTDFDGSLIPPVEMSVPYNSEDGIVRGGIINATNRAKIDFLRLKEYFLTPNGTNFLRKQVLLQNMNPLTEETKLDLSDDPNSTFFGGTSRFFNPIQEDSVGTNNLSYSSISSILGIFINRAGTDLNSYGVEEGYNYNPNNPTKYEYQVRKKAEFDVWSFGDYRDDAGVGQQLFFENVDVNNRLLQLYQTKTWRGTVPIDIADGASTILEAAGDFLGDLVEGVFDFFGQSGAGDFLSNQIESAFDFTADILSSKDYKETGVTIDPNVLLLYGGGPASKDGISPTIIKRYVQDNKGNKITVKVPMLSLKSPDTPLRNHVHFRKMIPSIESITNNVYKSFDKEPEFGSGDGVGGLGIKSDDPENSYDLESRIRIGSPGTLGKSWNYGASDSYDVGHDQLNKLDIQQVTDGQFGLHKYRDLIRFRIEAIQTDKPNVSDTMFFRAFLEGWNDNFQSTWNQYKYNGRGENFYTYNSFDRKISFNFKIAAQSRAEMKPLYRKLNFLISNLAPDYGGEGNLRMRGPLTRLTVGSHMDRIPGFFNSVNLAWLTNYPYEIVLDDKTGGKDSSMVVLPHVLDVQCAYQPIHNFLPRKSISDSPFIIPHENNGSLREGQKWYKNGAEVSNNDTQYPNGSPLFDSYYDGNFMDDINQLGNELSDVFNIFD